MTGKKYPTDDLTDIIFSDSPEFKLRTKPTYWQRATEQLDVQGKILVEEALADGKVGVRYSPSCTLVYLRQGQSAVYVDNSIKQAILKMPKMLLKEQEPMT